MSDWNAGIIEEFRGTDGTVGGVFEGKPLLLLHTRGARTGNERVNPLMYQQIDERIAIFASKAGAPDSPDWYYNLIAHPEIEIEIGAETRSLIARVAGDEERGPIWTRQKQDYPQFAEYEASTDRTIPVIILEPR